MGEEYTMVGMQTGKKRKGGGTGSIKNSNCKAVRKHTIKSNVPRYFDKPMRASVYHSMVQLCELSEKD